MNEMRSDDEIGKMSRARINAQTRDEIVQLIELANLLQPGRMWPTPAEIDAMGLNIWRLTGNLLKTEEMPIEAGLAAREELNTWLEPLWKTATKRWPPRVGDRGGVAARDLRGHRVVLRRQRDPHTYTFDQPDRAELYRVAYITRDVLRRVARSAETQSAQPWAPDLPAPLPRLQLIGGTVDVGPDFYRDWLLGAFKTPFPANAIRICRGCERLYWARREDQPACSRRCADRVRQRKWRKDHPDYNRRAERAERSSHASKSVRLLRSAIASWQGVTVLELKQEVA